MDQNNFQRERNAKVGAPGVDEFSTYIIQQVNWKILRTSSGTAESIPGSLTSLLYCNDEDEGLKHYWNVDNSVVVQGKLFESAEYIIPILLRGLIHSTAVGRKLCAELLLQIVAGRPDKTEIDLGNVDLAHNCREKARKGLVIFYWMLFEKDIYFRDNAVEILSHLEGKSVDFLLVLNNLKSQFNDPEFSSFVSLILRDSSSDSN